MSFSGLRGAVAFYLALNVNSEFKHLIITTTIALIIVTIVGLGGTTTCLLKAMAKYFPEDGIFYNDEGEDLLIKRERGISDLSDSLYERNFENGGGRGVEQDRSIGVITRLEKFDMDYGRKYLRKDGWEDFLGEEGENDGQYNYEVDFKNSPDKGKYYDNLSNYQVSMRKYIDETVVNLPYEDRKSVRLSVMSNREDPNKKDYLNPNRKRAAANIREEYERQMQLSVRRTGGGAYTKSMRGEQLSVMSMPREFQSRGKLNKAKERSLSNDKPNKREEEDTGNRRLNIPPMNINIGGLDEISSKGSQGGSKNEQASQQPDDEPKESAQITKEENKAVSKKDSFKKSGLKVTFDDPKAEKSESNDNPEDQSKEDNSKETGSELKPQNNLNPDSKPEEP